MKKHLIAAAVAAAVAVPAMAQVTISGTVEAGYATKEIAPAAVTNNTVSRFVTTPNITFSGSEDLGGGLKANFRLTKDVNTTNGGGQTTAADTFQITTIGLSGAFGSVKFGRDSHATRDAGGIYRFFGDIGRLAAAPGTVTQAFNSGAYQTNLVEYATPSFNGFVGTIGKSDAGKVAAGTTSASVQSIGLRGSFQGISLSLGRETIKAAADASKNELTTVAAAYDFGSFRVGAVYAKNDPMTTAESTATGFHVAVPMGGPWTVGGSFTTYENKATADADTDVLAIAARYDLSKRTSVFATYQSVDANTNAGGILSSRGLEVGEIAGKRTDGFGISVVHNF